MSIVCYLPAPSVICRFYEDQLGVVQRQLWLSLNDCQRDCCVKNVHLGH